MRYLKLYEEFESGDVWIPEKEKNLPFYKSKKVSKEDIKKGGKEPIFYSKSECDKWCEY